MEKVNTVSINGISFILEENAHQLLKKYLDTLEHHYQSNPNGAEIMDSLEGRIAELLIDRGCKSGVATESDIREIIDIIGKPEEIYSESEDKQAENGSGSNEIKKRLYRNPDDKILGGVFGGLAAYFNFDPTILRVVFSIIFVLSLIFDKEIFGIWPAGYLVLAYFILLFCMPLAQTTEQKCSMRGESLSFNNIEKQVLNKKDKKSRNGSDFWAVILKIFLLFNGVLLVFIGACGLIGLAAAFFGVAIAGITIPSAILNFVSDAAGLPGWVLRVGSILTALAVFLPFIGMLYGGVSMLFNFKSPKWKPGLVIFILWILSLAGLTAIGISGSMPFWSSREVENSDTLNNISDTLHIEFVDIDKWENSKILASGDYDSYKVSCIKKTNKKNFQVAAYPDINIHRISNGDPCITITYDTFGKNLDINDYNDNHGTSDFIRQSSDTIFVSPVIYGKGHRLNKIDMDIEINVPDSVTVDIGKPIKHDFDDYFDFSDLKGILREW